MEQTVLSIGPYIQISVTEEQKLFARELVEHSLRHHQVSNIWDKHAEKISQTRMMRFTGSLGEIVFADCYHLPRPLRSFGAMDGQDWGQDFVVDSGKQAFSLDIKSMKRRSGYLSSEYVLNIPASQLHKPGSRTSHYFCISFHQCAAAGTIASLLGFIDKNGLQAGDTGQFYKAGSKRVRTDGTAFTFNEHTYEVRLAEIDPPLATNYIKGLKGFQFCSLKI